MPDTETEAEDLRVDHRTVQNFNGRTTGLAARDGICPHCDQEVDEFEPLLLVGKYVEEDPETKQRSMDLSNAWWICQKGSRR